MSHLRVRALDKPIIIQSITFNHRPQSHHSSEEPSFLKLSQPNSIELGPLHESSLFASMQNTLNILEAKSIGKITQIRKQIQKYHCPQRQFPNNSLNAQKKQLDSVMCRKLQFPYAQEQYDHFNFEMDQNLNYICDRQNEISSNLATQLIDSKRTVSQKATNFKQVLMDSKASSNKWKDVYYSRRQNSLTQKKSQRKRRTSNSSCRQSIHNPTRTYEQILSNYSTSRLLAMEKKGR